MSYLLKAKATCGRHAEKPNAKDDHLNYEDENSMPLQDQIDNLRAKISLKEKYNKALREEVSETNSGAALMINELTLQNKQLRDDFQLEILAEQLAVKKALRSYRLFQLAVNEKSAESVINWLDDKIFDLSKTLNEGIYLLKQTQSKIQDAEGQVQYLEKCPIPGSEEWELRAEDDRTSLECAIEARRANRDAAQILNKRYHEILYRLKSERGKWPHAMESMEKAMNLLQKELKGLETMLEDAVRFREEAREKLGLTEEEASANRKQRRSQMNKMKKSVEKALDANTAKYVQTNDRRKSFGLPPSSTPSRVASNLQDIKTKQLQVQEYEDRVNKLVQAMRVSDLRQCPKRLNTVRKVSKVLKKEMSMKKDLRDILLKHKYRLELIRQYLKYSGWEEQESFQMKVEDVELELQDIDAENTERTNENNDDGIILSDLRYALIGLEDILNHGKRHGAPPANNEHLKVIMKRLVGKIKHLVDNVENLKKSFKDKSKPQRSYAGFVKYNMYPRFIRVGAADEMEPEDNSDPELDIIDSKIPSRQEIKSTSERFYAQALLRRGLR